MMMPDITCAGIKTGRPLSNILIIDGHCHIGGCNNIDIPDGSSESMLASMDAIGTDIACIAANPSVCADYRFGNDMVAEACMKYPDRFIGYITLNPNYIDDMADEVDRCSKMPGMRALKLHPAYHTFPVDHRAYHHICEKAAAEGFPVLVHVWGRQDVEGFERLAEGYPGVRFIMGHGGAETRAMEIAVDVTNRHDNCFIDLALSIAREGNVEWLVKEVGSKKVIFGTDMPFFDPIPAFGRVAFAEISEEDKKNIFGSNMQRLLDAG